MKLNSILLLFILNIQLLISQEILQPQDAVALALNKNYDIMLAKNEADIVKINNSKANAGMLPNINVTTGDVFNLNNINQKFSSGQEINKNWIPVNSFNAALNMNWTIFDGLSMFAKKDRLNTLESIGALQLKIQMQNTIADVLKAYFDVVQQKQKLKALHENLKISQERMSLSEKKFDVGYADKTAYLQAKVDYNTQKINIFKQETLLAQQKIILNDIIGRDNTVDFDVIDNIDVLFEPNLQNIIDTSSTQNLELQVLKQNIEVAKYLHKEIKAQKMPIINFNTSYSFTQNNSKAGFQIFNRTYGPNLGVNAMIPIFNGGIIKKQLEASAINIASKQISLEKKKNNMQAQIISAFKIYQYSKDVLSLNENNIVVAKENLDITLEKFKLNQANSIEIRQAQSSYEDALFNAIAARYTAKISEIELKKISNILILENE
jgi:outer membrane protein